MCNWGDTLPVRLKIQADLSCSGEEYWKDVEIDRCIAPLVAALQVGGIDMRGSCCGHGEAEGTIDLQDGRVLVILSPEAGQQYLVQRQRGLSPWLRRLHEDQLG